jgi:hypothetical protein
MGIQAAAETPLGTEVLSPNARGIAEATAPPKTNAMIAVRINVPPSMFNS